MSRKLNIAIVGCGRIAKIYKMAFDDLQDKINVVCAIDKVMERAKEFASCYDGCTAAIALETLWDMDVDVVHICTPHFLHEEQVIDCLNHDINVLTEKPMAITLAGADRMIDTARKSSKKLSVIFQNRYVKGVVAAKKLISSGELGEVLGAWSLLTWWRPPSYYECDWKGTWEHEGGGVLIDQAIHSIDMVQYLVGHKVKSIEGTINNRILKNVEVEDVASAAIEFDNGAVYSLFATNYYCQNSPIQIEITCEKGTINVKGFDVTITKEGETTLIKSTDDTDDGIEEYWGSHHKIQIEEYYDTIINDEEVVVTPEDARVPLEIVLSVYKSSREKKKIIINE